MRKYIEDAIARDASEPDTLDDRISMDLSNVNPDEELIDEDPDDESSEDGEEDASDTPVPRRRGRPRKSPSHKPRGRKSTLLGQKPQQIRHVIESRPDPTLDQSMDSYDEWLEKVEDEFGKFHDMQIKWILERKAPSRVGQVQTSGHLVSQLGSYLTLDEVAQQFGGGEYLCKIQIPRIDGAGPHINRRKVFVIAGAPRIDHPFFNGGGGAEKLSVSRSKNGEGGAEVLADLLKDQLERSAQTASTGIDGDLLNKAYATSSAAVQRAAADQVQAFKEAMERRERDAAAKVEELRKQNEKLQSILDDQRARFDDKLRESSSGSTQLLAALLPTFSQSSTEQIRNSLETFRAREQEIERRHTDMLQSQATLFETRMTQLSMGHQQELARLETTHANAVTLLQQQLQLAVAERDRLSGEVSQLRNQLQSYYQEKAASSDPLDQMSKMQAMLELARSLNPSQPPEGGLGEDAPAWMKMVTGLAESLGPTVQKVLETRQHERAMVDQVAAIRAQQMQTSGFASAPQAPMAPVAPVNAPSALPPAPDGSEVRLKKEDLAEALSFVVTAKNAGTPPESVAAGARMYVDGKVLEVLGRMNADTLRTKMDAHGLWPEGLLSDEGMAYVQAVLNNLSNAEGA